MIEFGKWIEPIMTKAKQAPTIAPFFLKFCSEFFAFSYSVEERFSAMSSRKSLCERMHRVNRRVATESKV